MSGRNEKASGSLANKAPALSTEQPSGSRVRKHSEESPEFDAKRPKICDGNSENSMPVEELFTEQPRGSRVRKHSEEASELDAKKPKTNDGNSVNSTSIWSLDEYCWGHIFSYLCLRDQLQLSSSNKRIKEIYKIYIKYKYRRIGASVTNRIDGFDLAHLLDLMGDNLISYESPLDSDGEQHLWLLRTHSQELQHLKMTFRRPRWSDLLSLQKLTSLHARLNFASPEIYIDFFSNLVYLPRLRKLKLETPHYKGDGLHVLENLESLEVGAHPGFDAECLVFCCQKMKWLRHLDIGKHIDNLTAENFRVIVRNCRNLERLVFGEHLLDYDVPYELVCRLPRLKHLQLWYSDSIKPHFIEELINKPGDPLESLILLGYALRHDQVGHICEISSLRELHVACDTVPLTGLLKLTNIEYLHIDMPDVTNEQLMMLLKACPLLTVLNVRNCQKITLEFVKNATQFCKQEDPSRPNVLVVYLDNSSVDWRYVWTVNNDKFIRFKWGSLRSPILINEELSHRN